MKRAAWRLSLQEPPDKTAHTAASSAGKDVKEEALLIADAPEAAKVKGTPPPKNPELVRMVRDLSLMTLQNSASIRQLNAAVYSMGILPGKLKCIQASLKAGKAYSAAVKAAGKGHLMGSPHLHKGLAFLEGLQEDELIQQHATLQQELKNLAQAFNTCSVQSEAEGFLTLQACRSAQPREGG